LLPELNNSKMNRIKEVLEQKGIKQIWLAEKLEKSYNMVNSYAQNRRQPSLEDLYKIADILDVDIKELIVSNKNMDSDS
jgi:transcriptional regulator with XRE-family HTH domain